MTVQLSAIPRANLPFPVSEYEKRQQRVLNAAAAAGLDAILVTAHGHLRYLSGYSGYGGYFGPFPLILAPGLPATYVVREYEVQSVRDEGCVKRVIGYTHLREFGKVCADVLRKHGLQKKRVGLELGCWNLAPADVFALQAELPELKIVDASKIVSAVATVKSDLELRAMRDAMATTDLAIRTFQQTLHSGVTEIEVADAVQEAVRLAGGEPANVVSLGFGDRNKLPHGKPSSHRLSNNEPAMIEVGCYKDFYAAALVRSAVLGRHPETEALHALAEEALEAGIAAAKPGVTLGEVDAAVRKVVARSRRPDAFRHRTGYQIGAPWNERGNLSLEPGATEVIETGMTFHMPIILFSEGGYLFGCSETVVVTERGAAPLSTTTHALYRTSCGQ
ncbi:Xaa-Pro peptidase family protein [Bradyrhizobium sp. IC3069]|uniref:M24 family metallopeptidase n=1 Tax=unclassified Bradyrhizobium TaxID=2631580 RepID=UPI001CD6DEB2